MGFNITMSWKVLIVLVIFTIALSNAQTPAKPVDCTKQVEAAKKVARKEEQDQAEKKCTADTKKAVDEAKKTAQIEADKQKATLEADLKKANKEKTTLEAELEKLKLKLEGIEKANKDAEEEAKKEEALKDALICKKDVLVTCDGTHDGSKKDEKTKENPCVGYHSWTAQQKIFGCYKKQKVEATARIWPFTSSAYAGSTQNQVVVPEKEKEYWKQENGANGLWHKNGIYHLGDEETKGQTFAKAMLKSDLLTAGKIWNYWGDEKWHKNTGVVIKCGC